MGEDCLTLGLISDIHTTGKGKSRRLLAQAFDALREEQVDLVLSAGDNVNGCQKEEFEVLETSLKNHLAGIPFFAAAGNHDYFSNHPQDVPQPEAREAFFETMLSQPFETTYFQNGNYVLNFQSHHIIFLDCIQNNKKFCFDEQTAQWLEAQLSQSEGEGWRIVVNHLPLGNHVLGTPKQKVFMAGNARLQDMLNRHSRVLYVAGHTHYRIDSVYPSAEQDAHGNIYLNAGSVGNTQPCLYDVKQYKALRNSLPHDSEEYRNINRYFKMGSMGLLVRLANDAVHVDGYDFARGAYIDRAHFTFSESSEVFRSI